MSLANKITLFRIVLGPLVFGSIIFDKKPFIIFFLLANLVLDGLDGFFARKYKEKSWFGEVIDPLVDFLFFSFVCFGIYLTGIWEINLVFLPFFFIILGFFLDRKSKDNFNFLHTKTKYIHTPFLYFSIIFIIFKVSFWKIFFLITIALLTFSYFEFFLRSIKKFSKSYKK